MKTEHSFDLVVLGGGAAGFFCAVNAARLRPGLRVCLLEKTNKLLSKVSVSGGGRCSVTHACFHLVELSRHYPRGAGFVRKAFHHFSPTDTVEWFRERKVMLKTEADGRMFPTTDQSSSIVNALLQEASRYQVDIRLQQEVVEMIPDSSGWTLKTATGLLFHTTSVCVAMGGLNKPGMDRLFQGLKHQLVPSLPSLFTFNMSGHPITKLMGLSVPQVRIRITGSKLESEGPVLITHWGMSGPAVLRLSAWGARELAALQYQFTARINWLPEHTENSMRECLQQYRQQLARQAVSARCPFALPQRLWEYLLLREAHVPHDKRWADMSQKETQALIKVLIQGDWPVKGKTTFKEEFVTAGGIELGGIDHRTMQSKFHPGLYFAGEVMDVDGITGGFNFQHAWTSGFLAAKSIAAATGAN